MCCRFFSEIQFPGNRGKKVIIQHPVGFGGERERERGLCVLVHDIERLENNGGDSSAERDGPRQRDTSEPPAVTSDRPTIAESGGGKYLLGPISH